MWMWFILVAFWALCCSWPKYLTSWTKTILVEPKRPLTLNRMLNKNQRQPSNAQVQEDKKSKLIPCPSPLDLLTKFGFFWAEQLEFSHRLHHLKKNHFFRVIVIFSRHSFFGVHWLNPTGNTNYQGTSKTHIHHDKLCLSATSLEELRKPIIVRRYHLFSLTRKRIESCYLALAKKNNQGLIP